MYFNQLESDKLQARRKARRKQREIELKQAKKRQAKRQFARKHDGLNIWQVGLAYSTLGILGCASLFFWFYSILSVGV
jgi:hypothetical protein